MRFLILLSLFTFAYADEVGINLYGVSAHSKPGYNSWNPGLGVDYINSDEIGQIRGGLFASAGAYKDSFSQRAYYAVPGLVIDIGDPVSWHTRIMGGVGYWEGSAFNGLGALVAMGVGYDRFEVYTTILPKSRSIDANALGLWARIRMARF
jgi:hypothetical protein